MGRRIVAFLIGLICISIAQAQVPVQTIGTTNNRVVVRGQLRADSGLILSNTKPRTQYLNNAIIFNSDLRTLEVFDSITQAWYPLSRYTLANGPIEGMTVNWISGLNFQVTSGVYAIASKIYSFESDDVTLDAADPSLPRIDVIAVDTLGQIVVVEGVPAADPAKPQTSLYQLELTNVLVNAGATEPAGYSKSIIYNENTESTVSSSITVNANNTSFPFLGTKAIDVSSHPSGSVTFTLSSTVDLTDYTSLVIYVRLKSAYPNGTRIGIEWLKQNGILYETVSDNVLVSSGTYGYNRSTTGAYQAIQIPMSAFTFLNSPSAVKQLSLFFTGSGGGMYIDYVHLQNGAITPGISVTTFNNRSGNVQPLYEDYAPFFLDTVYRRVDSVFGKKNNVERFLFKDSVGTGGGGSQSFDDVLSVGNFTSRTPRTSAGYEVRNTGNTATLAEIFNNGNTNSELYLYNTTDSRYAMLKYTGLEFQLPSFKIQRINPFPTPTPSSVTFTLPNTATNRYLPTTFKLNGTTVAAGDTGLVDLGNTNITGLVTAGTNVSITGSGTSGSPYVINSSGGGGSSDSSWVSTETGTQQSALGYLVNSTLSALPSGWADVTPAASVTFSGKMIVSGGATTTASVTGNTGTGTAYANRIDMDYYPYSKMRYAFTVVPQDKTGTSNGFALHFKANAITTSFAMRILFDLTNTADSGKISMGYDYSAAVATSANLSHNAGDTLDIEVVRDHWLIKARMYNRRTGKQVDTKYYSYGSDFGTGGMAYLALLGGTQHFLSAKVESYDLKNGAAFTFLGDSQFAGSGATNEDKTFPFQVMRGNKNKIVNLSAAGVTLSAIVTSHVPAAIALNNPVIVGAGFNDRSVLSTDTTTFKTRLDAVVDPLIAAGLPVWVTTLVPTNSTLATFNANFDLAIINYCAANGIPVIRIDSILKKNGDASNRIKENYLGADNVHWSDSGQYVSAQKVLQIIGERVPTFFKDTTSPVKIYNVPTGEQNMAPLVLDEKTGEIKKIPATTFDIIYNSYKYGGVGTTGQRNTAIHTDGAITTDSLFRVNNRIGLVLQFNGSTGLAASTTAGNNILMSNRATTSGYPHAVPTFTGNYNVVFETLNTKSVTATYTGSDNFIWNKALAGTLSFSNVISLGTGANFSLTSGSNHVHLGADAGRGITTGSNTIVIASKNTSGNNLPATLNNAIILGDMTSSTASTNEYQAYDIAFSTSYFNDENIWLGGRTKPEKIIYVNFPSISTVSNYVGNDGYFRAGKGSGTGRSGFMRFQTWNSTTSGTTLHSTANTEFTIWNKGTIFGNTTSAPNASALVEMVSTEKGFLPPRMTATQASAISSPAEGLLVYVTDTNGTFTSKGWWGYNGTTWEKLNN